MVKHRRFLSRRVRPALILMLVVLLSVLPSVGHQSVKASSVKIEDNSLGLIPFEDQPFYPDLEQISSSWTDVVLGQVVGTNPKATLLNFYAVMAKVGYRAEWLGQNVSFKSGLFSSEKRLEQIDDTNLLFSLAVKSLDSTNLPESVRSDMSDEAAIQLKHVLDYVFTHSREPIVIPGLADQKARQESGAEAIDSWRIPGTAIELTRILEDNSNNDKFYF